MCGCPKLPEERGLRGTGDEPAHRKGRKRDLSHVAVAPIDVVQVDAACGGEDVFEVPGSGGVRREL